MHKYNIWMPCNEKNYEKYIKDKLDYKLIVVSNDLERCGLCLRNGTLTFSTSSSHNYKQSHKIIDYNSQLFIALSKVKEKESLVKLQVGDIVVIKDHDHKYYDELLQITEISNNIYAYFDPIERGYTERRETIGKGYSFSMFDWAYVCPTLTDIATRFNITILINKNDSSITSNNNNNNNPIIISYY